MGSINVDMDVAKSEYSCSSVTDLLISMKDDIEWLATHNKNYNKGQYYRILSLQNIINGMKA